MPAFNPLGNIANNQRWMDQIANESNLVFKSREGQKPLAPGETRRRTAMTRTAFASPLGYIDLHGSVKPEVEAGLAERTLAAATLQRSSTAPAEFGMAPRKQSLADFGLAPDKHTLKTFTSPMGFVGSGFGGISKTISAGRENEREQGHRKPPLCERERTAMTRTCFASPLGFITMRDPLHPDIGPAMYSTFGVHRETEAPKTPIVLESPSGEDSKPIPQPKQLAVRRTALTPASRQRRVHKLQGMLEKSGASKKETKREIQDNPAFAPWRC